MKKLLITFGFLVLLAMMFFGWQGHQSSPSLYTFQVAFPQKQGRVCFDETLLQTWLTHLQLDAGAPMLRLPVQQQPVQPRQIRVMVKPLSQLPAEPDHLIDPVYRGGTLYRIIQEEYQERTRVLTFTVFQAELPEAERTLQTNLALAFFRPLFISSPLFRQQGNQAWVEFVEVVAKTDHPNHLFKLEPGWRASLRLSLKPGQVYADYCDNKYACDPIKYALKCADGTVCNNESDDCPDSSTCASRPDGCDGLKRKDFNCSGDTENACLASASCDESIYCTEPVYANCTWITDTPAPPPGATNTPARLTRPPSPVFRQIRGKPPAPPSKKSVQASLRLGGLPART
jgi:hypothetical protein